MNKIRVRFAPSPTGYLHIGGLRTALFNWLYARRMGGKFILRIEDTDQTRLVPDALDDITASLAWLGIDWDEGPDKGGPLGPYTQSQRLELYQKHASELVESGRGYYCFCTPERLASLRENPKADTRYDGHCRDLSPDEVKKNLEAGVSRVIRLKIPESGETIVKDLLRGELSFENKLQDDLVLLKSDGFPTYHLANIVDDHLMEISHVMRGEEWISSTPKHVLLYQAFGWEPPIFVHLPVILSPKGGKLSKRDGATTVREFIQQGYLPEAMTNFLALLGWALDGETSMFSVDELKKVFSLEKIGMSSPVFDKLKLDDYNGKYIRQKSDQELLDLIRPFIAQADFFDPKNETHQTSLKKIIPLYRERLVLLSDLSQQARFFFTDQLAWGDGSSLIPKKSSLEDASLILKRAEEGLADLEVFTQESLETRLRALVEELGFKAGQVFMALRVAVTAETVSPGLFETLEALGREAVLTRIRQARAVLEQGNA